MGDDNDEIRSQVTNSVLGLGGAEGIQGEQGVHFNGRADQGGGIVAKISQIKTRYNDTLVEHQ
jgi:hypothetical protein